MEGEIIESLRNRMFKIRLDNGHEMLGYTAGRMKRYRTRMLLGRRVELLGRDDPVHEAPLGRGRRVDRLPGEQELERALPSDRPRNRDHRRRAEEADLHSRRREARLLCGDREVAGGDQLAAGGGR